MEFTKLCNIADIVNAVQKSQDKATRAAITIKIRELGLEEIRAVHLDSFAKDTMEMALVFLGNDQVSVLSLAKPELQDLLNDDEELKNKFMWKATNLFLEEIGMGAAVKALLESDIVKSGPPLKEYSSFLELKNAFKNGCSEPASSFASSPNFELGEMPYTPQSSLRDYKAHPLASRVPDGNLSMLFGMLKDDPKKASDIITLFREYVQATNRSARAMSMMPGLGALTPGAVSPTANKLPEIEANIKKIYHEMLNDRFGQHDHYGTPPGFVCDGGMSGGVPPVEHAFMIFAQTLEEQKSLTLKYPQSRMNGIQALRKAESALKAAIFDYQTENSGE